MLGEQTTSNLTHCLVFNGKSIPGFCQGFLAGRGRGDRASGPFSQGVQIRFEDFFGTPKDFQQTPKVSTTDTSDQIKRKQCITDLRNGGWVRG